MCMMLTCLQCHGPFALELRVDQEGGAPSKYGEADRHKIMRSLGDSPPRLHMVGAPHTVLGGEESQSCVAIY